jgi:hypothetical protein
LTRKIISSKGNLFEMSIRTCIVEKIKSLADKASQKMGIACSVPPSVSSIEVRNISGEFFVPKTVLFRDEQEMEEYKISNVTFSPLDYATMKNRITVLENEIKEIKERELSNGMLFLGELNQYKKLVDRLVLLSKTEDVSHDFQIL